MLFKAILSINAVGTITEGYKFWGGLWKCYRKKSWSHNIKNKTHGQTREEITVYCKEPDSVAGHSSLSPEVYQFSDFTKTVWDVISSGCLLLTCIWSVSNTCQGPLMGESSSPPHPVPISALVVLSPLGSCAALIFYWKGRTLSPENPCMHKILHTISVDTRPLKT